MYLYFSPMRNKRSNFIRIAINGEKFETWARIYFRFFKAEFKAEQKKSQIISGFKVQSLQSCSKFREILLTNSTESKLISSKSAKAWSEEGKKSNCKGRRVNIFDFPISTLSLSGCQIYLWGKIDSPSCVRKFYWGEKRGQEGFANSNPSASGWFLPSWAATAPAKPSKPK